MIEAKGHTHTVIHFCVQPTMGQNSLALSSLSSKQYIIHMQMCEITLIRQLYKKLARPSGVVGPMQYDLKCIT